MSTISINRPWAYFGVHRSLNILVNSEKVGIIKTKDSFEFNLPEGEYNLQVSMDWCKSKPMNIRVSKGYDLRFLVNTQTILFSMFTCFFLPSKVFSVNLESKI
jgi:hypothetical protein